MKFVGLSLLLSLCACSAQPSESGARVQSQRIIGGSDSPAADDAVMLILTARNITSVCSSVLIAPNLLLTARHCVSAEYPSDGIHCNPDGSLILPSGGQLGASVSPDKISVFAGATVPSNGSFPGGTVAAKGQQIITGDGPSVCKDDIALVVLDRALDQPPARLGLGLVVAQDAHLSVVGYGLTETTDPNSLYSTRHRRDDVPVQYVGILPDTFTLGRSVCKGDSGGPAFDPGTGAVVGAYSLGFPGANAADCSSEEALNYFVDVTHYEALLRQAFTAAGQPFPDPIVLDAGTDSGSSAAGAPASDDAGTVDDAGGAAGVAGTAGAGGSGTQAGTSAVSGSGGSKSCQVSNVGGGASGATALFGALCAALVAVRRRLRVRG
jgi:hypothetical protein